MKKLVLGSLTALGAAILALAITPAPAKADTIAITDNINGATLCTGSGGCSFGPQSLGANWTVQGSATGSPFLVEPDLDSNTIDVSTSGAGTLILYVNETLATPVTNLLSAFASTSITGAISSVTEQTYLGGVLVASTTFNNEGTTAQAATLGGVTVAASTAEEEVYTINATGAGSTDDNISTSAVPEAGSLGMLGAGLLGIALLGFSRRSKVMVAA